jgi:DNA-binding transcriptional regulator YiaG
MKKNQDIREIMERKRIKQYEVAEQLGVCEFTLSKWMCKDLTPEKRTKILDAINQTAENLGL